MSRQKTSLPLIVGIGGMNSAGRSSGLHSYKRLIHEVLSDNEMANTWLDLANRMGIKHGTPLSADDIETIIQGTLVRKIDSFDHEHVVFHHKAKLDDSSQVPSFIIKKLKLPKSIPATWKIEELNDQEVKVVVEGGLDVFIPDTMALPVSSGGNLPAGFDPGKLYNSHHHPRGLKLAIYGASDLLNSLGLEWEEIISRVKPDEIAVYAGSAFAQVDENSLAGLISQPLVGNRVNSKMLALSLPEMVADFINSYVINSVGTTGTNVGACATFLYNLRQGFNEIQLGKAKVVIVGNAEACVVPDIIEGFRAMGALATDDDLCALDNSDKPDHRRACRPFSTNAGFTVAEAAQFVVLMEEGLALELGVNIYGSVADVFINADANKKSIAGPGVGNYITVAKATALTKAILGQEGLNHTFVQSHGTGTPQNCATESHILNEVAKAFSIKQWPVTAIKAYVGHSLSPAAGDQLIASLGVWKYGWIPGIKTIDHYGKEVERSNLNILMDHLYVGENGNEMQAVIINSKGFGGNNATGVVLSPDVTLKMLQNKYGEAVIHQYKLKNQIIRATCQVNDDLACHGNEKITYSFGETVMDQSSVTIQHSKVTLSELKQDIDLPIMNPYSEYCSEVGF